jgi:hypothetical protein
MGGSAAEQAGLCPRCYHPNHEAVGECRACYCRSLQTAPTRDLSTHDRQICCYPGSICLCGLPDDRIEVPSHGG